MKFTVFVMRVGEEESHVGLHVEAYGVSGAIKQAHQVLAQTTGYDPDDTVVLNVAAGHVEIMSVPQADIETMWEGASDGYHVDPYGVGMARVRDALQKMYDERGQMSPGEYLIVKRLARMLRDNDRASSPDFVKGGN